MFTSSSNTHIYQLQINFKETKTCALLCEKEYKSTDDQHQEKLRLLQRGMKLNYQQHWWVKDPSRELRK